MLTWWITVPGSRGVIVIGQNSETQAVDKEQIASWPRR